MNDWAPEPQPVPPELEPDYQAEPYTDPWNSIMERIEGASLEQLLALYGGHPTDEANIDRGRD